MLHIVLCVEKGGVLGDTKMEMLCFPLYPDLIFFLLLCLVGILDF